MIYLLIVVMYCLNVAGFLVTKKQLKCAHPQNHLALVSWSYLPPIDEDATSTMEDGNINLFAPI